MAVFDDLSKEKLYLYPHKVEWKERIPTVCKAEAKDVVLDMEEPLKVECKHFIECIEDIKRPETDGYEGLRVLEVLQALQESLNQDGIRIELYGFKKTALLKKPLYFVHESSYVDEDVEIGEGTKIWHFCHILKGSKIGKNCKIGQNVVIGSNVSIGDGCKIQNNISIYEGVTLEDGVFCGPSVVFTNVFNPRAHIPRMDEIRKTLVKEGATIGANATIICGNTIGRYTFIGAGSVVTKDVPDYALVMGVPGKIAGWMCQCGIKLGFDPNKIARCNNCNRIYERINEVTVREKNK